MTRVRREFEPDRRKGMFLIAIVTAFTMVQAYIWDTHFRYGTSEFSFLELRIPDRPQPLRQPLVLVGCRYSDMLVWPRERARRHNLARSPELAKAQRATVVSLERAGMFFFASVVGGGVAALMTLALRSRFWITGLLLLAQVGALGGALAFVGLSDRYVRDVHYWPFDPLDTVTLGALLQTRILIVLWSLLAAAAVIVWIVDRINEKPIQRSDTDTPAFD